MKDQDRADRLARAIEEMAQGSMPVEIDDDELRELLTIARIRMDAAEQATGAAGETQHVVLERLLARLHARDNEESDDTHPSDIVDSDSESGEVDIGELQDVISLRRRIAEEAADLAEAHRQTVWQRVQDRIAAGASEKRGFFRWPFGKRDRQADEFGVALDRMTMGEPIWEAKDSRLEELLQVARLRQAAVVTAGSGSGSGFMDQQARVWARIRPRLMARQMIARRPRVFRRRELNLPPWPKLAAAGAAIALAVAILGPLPATGFAQHPVVELVSGAGHVGVTETTTPPEAVPPVTRVVESNEVTVSEASDLLGAGVFEPASVPAGYTRVSSQYFPEPLTADEGGLFVLAYESEAGEPNSILVYQELASATNIAVEDGYAQDVGLVETDTSATYVNGVWRASEGGLTWGSEGSQTIVFDHQGVRTIIQTDDADMPMSELAAIATSMVDQAPTD